MPGFYRQDNLGVASRIVAGNSESGGKFTH